MKIKNESKMALQNHSPVSSTSMSGTGPTPTPKLSTPGKKRKKSAKKIELDNFELCTLRNIVNSFYTVRKEVPTLKKILAAAKTDLNFAGGITTLRLILVNHLGYKFKKCKSTRHVFKQKPDIAACRSRYPQKKKENNDLEIGDNDASVEPESANEDIQEFHSESTQGKHTLGKSDKSAEVPKQSSKKSTSGDTATHKLRTKSAKKDKDAIEPASSTASIEEYEKFGEAIASTLNAMPDQAASRLQADLQRVLELYEEEKTCCKSTSKKERKNLPIYPILKITKITPESTECQAVNNRSKRKFFTTEETEKCSKRKTNSNEMVENVNEDGNQGFHVANCKLEVNFDYPHFLDIDKEPSKDPLTFEVKEENV